MDSAPSLFGFGEILCDTAASLLEFLVAEVEKEKPDFIMHSHLALWGKLLAAHYGLPSIALFSTFVLEKTIMLPYYKRTGTARNGYLPGESHLSGVKEAIGFNRKLLGLHSRLGLDTKPDIWNVLVNKGNLNISFIREEFQPARYKLGPEYAFVGYPAVVDRKQLRHELIYLSLGSMVTNDIGFYTLCCKVLGNKPWRCIFSVGRKLAIGSLTDVPPNISIVPFVDQVAVLKSAALFLTKGGMASVQEAFCTLTPMIVIPGIPEQRITAERITQLGIGIHLDEKNLTATALEAAINECMLNNTVYVDRMRTLLDAGPEIPASTLAFNLIDRYLSK
jgi:MGT family glycosyltransferase